MAYSLIDQVSLDLNWYFIDHYWHPCHVASGGGVLPNVIAENDENNDSLNGIILNLPEIFESERNTGALPNLQRRGTQNTDAYFNSFESMARKGFFSFDKYDLHNPEDSKYFLVAYPKYFDYGDLYPISSKLVPLFPRTRGTVKNSFMNPFDLVNFFNKLHQ